MFLCLNLEPHWRGSGMTSWGSGFVLESHTTSGVLRTNDGIRIVLQCRHSSEDAGTRTKAPSGLATIQINDDSGFCQKQRDEIYHIGGYAASLPRYDSGKLTLYIKFRQSIGGISERIKSKGENVVDSLLAPTGKVFKIQPCTQVREQSPNLAVGST